MVTTDVGIIDALANEVPACLAYVVTRASRLKPEASTVLTAVIASSAECLQQLSHHPEGKSQIREAGGIQGALCCAAAWLRWSCTYHAYRGTVCGDA
jgi:hypothetical protein